MHSSKKILAIGGCGINIADFIKKQNDKYLEVYIVNSKDEFFDLDIKEDDIVFSISGFGSDSAGDITQSITNVLKERNIDIKNIVILPFNIESNRDKSVEELEKLIGINENVEVFLNDDIADKNISMLDAMRLMDEKIYERISRPKQIAWKSIIIQEEHDGKRYKALMRYWSKDYVCTLLTPEFKTLDYAHMPYMAPSKFSLKDIEKITSKCLDGYRN